ncbi:wnt-activated inhibitory factor 2 [Danio aesculapii]|uniref:wnt-activated inhibitory factor 2 n=1 Tax=Danio aesculapii TaxID=1142201 RepID=UPI0024BF681C|nr:wnt-activated inhibitory factor 2 [Danio aesculapii]
MGVNGKHLRVLSHTLKRYHFTVWLMCSFVLSDEAQCPFNCTCFNRSVMCEDSEEIKLPLEVPRRTQILTLNNVNISVLIERAFSANGTNAHSLHELSLRDNNIQVIQSCAFCGLHRLHLLDLSRNRLEDVHPEAFSELNQLRNLNLSNTLTAAGANQLSSALDSLNSLQILDLSGNRLKTIPLSGFGKFSLTTLNLTHNSITTLDTNELTKLSEYREMRVYLSHNPFDCRCDRLREFHDWLKNSSQCADSKNLKCAQPKVQKDLRVESVDCKNVGSFVLLGIVLALIGVVFLMVLYLNRRGIKRWLNNIREACRDQMEVYHYRYEQDSDPRLTNVAV